MTAPLDPPALLRWCTRQRHHTLPTNVPEALAANLRAGGDSVQAADGHDGTPPLSIGCPEQTGILTLGTDGGGISFARRDGSRFHALCLPSPPDTGPIAIVTSTTRRLVTLTERLADAGLATSLAVADPDAPPERFADWIAAAARHPATALLLLDALPSGDLAPVTEVLAPLADRLPILYTQPGVHPDERSLTMAWSTSIGALTAPDDATAAAIARLLLGPHGGTDDRWALIGPSWTPTFGRAPATRIHANNLDGLVDAAERALDTTAHDGVVVAIPSLSPEELDTLQSAAARWQQRADEVACVIVGLGGAATTGRLARTIPPPIAVLDATVASAALDLVADWPTRTEGSARLRALGGPADPSRLRRAAATVRARPAATTDPIVQAEIAASIGLAANPATFVRYIEDAPVKAAALGFPVEVAPSCSNTDNPRAASPRLVRTSHELQAVADPMLAAARRSGGLDAGLLLRAWPEQSEALVLTLDRHPRYGDTMRLDGPRDRHLQAVGLPGAETLATFLTRSGLNEPHTTALVAALQPTIDAAVIAHRSLAPPGEPAPTLTLHLLVTDGRALVHRLHLAWPDRNPVPGA